MSWPAVIPLLVDKSAWVRVHPGSSEWSDAIAADRVVICEIVRLELLFSARTARDARELDGELGTRRDMAITMGTLTAARHAVLDLAENGSDGYHRVPPTDAIIAACAAEQGCAVLHYDAHFDRLAEVLDFPSVWIVPRGTADR